jgi:hypothetical protein
MSTTDRPQPTAPTGPGPQVLALPPAVPLTASEQLALSRAQLAGWLDQDLEARAAAPNAGWQTWAAAPWLNRLRAHPVVSLALGAAVRAWLRPAPGGTAPAMQMVVIGTAFSVLRRHPKAVLVTAVLAAASLFWVRWRQRPRP